jgi:hypothetical protein
LGAVDLEVGVRTVGVAVRDFEAVLLDDEAIDRFICATAGNSMAARAPPPSVAMEALENFRKGRVIFRVKNFSTTSYNIVRSNK